MLISLIDTMKNENERLQIQNTVSHIISFIQSIKTSETGERLPLVGRVGDRGGHRRASGVLVVFCFLMWIPVTQGCSVCESLPCYTLSIYALSLKILP